jgi:hypothetical protein
MFFTDHVYTHQLYPHPSVQVFVETTYTIRMYQSYLPTRHDGPLSFFNDVARLPARQRRSYARNPMLGT